MAHISFTYFILYPMMVEWLTETCHGKMLINQSIVFGCCVCVDWIATDQLAPRDDVDQIICKLRDNSCDVFCQNTFRLCSNSARDSQVHSLVRYTQQRSLYDTQYLSWTADSVRQNSHGPQETSRFPIKSTNPSKCGRCSPLHIVSVWCRRLQWYCVWTLMTYGTALSTQAVHWQHIMLIK